MDVKIEPEEFDLIVVGTGLQESLIAGAAAKAGKSVLHLDSAAEYGSHWAGYTLGGFLKWAEREHERSTAECEPAQPPATAEAEAEQPPAPPDHGGGMLVPCCRQDGPVLYRSIELLVGDMSVAAKGREYMLDLAPKVTLCNGALVDTLVRSGAHNYLECKLLQGHSLYQHGALCAVPASKADVFKDRRLSLGDKRKLMRFLKEVVEALDAPSIPEDAAGASETKDDSTAAANKFDDRPLAKLLLEEGLPKDLQDFLLYGLVMAASDQGAEAAADGGDQPSSSGSGRQPPVSAADGKAAMGRYITSVGRYGANTGAFLVPLYGAGEVPQAFCRVAAVGGAVYVLRCPIQGFVLGGDPAAAGVGEGEAGRTAEKGEGAEAQSSSSVAEAAPRPDVTAVVTAAGQTLRCSALAGNPETLAGLLSPEDLQPSGWLSRCIAVTDAPLQDGESQSLVVIPPGALGERSPRHSVYALQMGSSAVVTPPGRFLVYFWTASVGEKGSASEELKPAVDALLRMPTEPAEPSAAASSEPPSEAEAEPREQQDSPAAAEVDLPRPTALVLGYYKQAHGLLCSGSPSVPGNVALCSLPDGDPDYRKTIEGAEALYGQLFPGERLFSVAPAPRQDDPDGSGEGPAAAAAAVGDCDSDDEDIQALGAALKAAGISGFAQGENSDAAGS